MIFGKNIFLFFKNNFIKINHCKFIHHKSHHTSQLPSMNSVRGIFLHHFQCKKVQTILNNIRYYLNEKINSNEPSSSFSINELSLALLIISLRQSCNENFIIESKNKFRQKSNKSQRTVLQFL